MYICQELIVEIFTRLPIEVILRFRSLSKSIRSCIDGPHFIRKHTLLSPQKFLIRHRNKSSGEGGYTLHSEDQLPLYPKRGYIDATALKFPFREPSEIVGSCNGILCLYDAAKLEISLWNPSIRRKVTMRDRPSSKCNDFSNIHFGFGFDPDTCDYKILRISYYSRSERPSFIYSVRRDTWCHIDSPTTPFTNVMSQACFLNGALHMVVENDSVKRLSKSDDDEKAANNIAYIMTFDLSTHVFGSIELPVPDCETRLLTIINGSLAMISTCEVDKSSSRIWVRRSVDNNNTASWSVEYELKLDLYDVKQLVGLSNNGSNFLYVRDRCKTYNRESGEESSLEKYGFRSKDMQMCVESLELLDTALPYQESIIYVHDDETCV